MKRLRDQISSLLYTKTGYLQLMKVLTGMCLMGIMPLELFITFGFGPYHVPAWRIGQTFFAFPEPPHWVSIIVWSLDFIACSALVFGARSRLIPLFLFLVWLYYQTLDRNIFQSSFVIILSMYLLAFSIHREPRSLSRLVIQVAVSTCYIFAGLHKFHPEFFSGLTMYQLLGQGHLLRPELLPAIHWLQAPRWFTDLSTYLVIASELFIGFGLWFKVTRIPAVITGVLLHLLLTISIPGIELFAPVMFTGYLAFFEPRKVWQSAPALNSCKKPMIDKVVAAIACIVCIAMPARLFFAKPFAYLHMSLYDRVPWGFSMFLFNEEIKAVNVQYHEGSSWKNVSLEGRMAASSSTSDLIALAYYIAKIHPQADCVFVGNVLQINGHGQKIRRYLYFPADKKLMVNETVTDGMSLTKRRK